MRKFDVSRDTHYPGVPARDLDDEEWDALTDEQRESAGWLYKAVKGRRAIPEPEPAPTEPEPVAASETAEPAPSE